VEERNSKVFERRIKEEQEIVNGKVEAVRRGQWEKERQTQSRS